MKNLVSRTPDDLARARQFEAEMAAMPVAMIHELPAREAYTLAFCLWLQENFDRLLQEEWKHRVDGSDVVDENASKGESA